MKRTVRVTAGMATETLHDLADGPFAGETRRRARHELVKRHGCTNCGRPANVVCRGTAGCTPADRRAA